MMSTLNAVRPEILRNKLLLKDVESEMKKEFDRRKKLRLQQVRQQSKDLAYTLREKVRQEKSHQLNLCKNKKEKQLVKWKEEKLRDLQELYRNCLEDVGQSHIKAAEQENLAANYLAQQERNTAIAANRGIEARRQKKLQDDENRHRSEAPLIRKQLVRTKEDIRSIFVSSLSSLPPDTNSKSSSENALETEKITQTVTEQKPKVRVLQEIPSNIELEAAVEVEVNNKEPVVNKPSTCSECGYACCCHRGSTNRSLRRRCFSESRLASDLDSEYDSDSTWPPRVSHQQSDYSSAATSVVKCYDYINNFRKKYKKPVCVTRHGQGQSSVRSSLEVQSEIDLARRKSKRLKEMADRERTRAKLAVYKDRINKDFDNLRKELESLSREEKSITSNMRPNTSRGAEVQPTIDVRQLRMAGEVDGNIIAAQQTVSTISMDAPNVLNVARDQRSREPSPTRPAITPFETSLHEVLDRIEERRKTLLSHLNTDDGNGPVAYNKGQDVIPYSSPTKQLSERAKSPSVDVELNKSSIGLNVSGLNKTNNEYAGVIDGVSVTVRVNKEPERSKRRAKSRYRTGDGSSSTSYNSPPDSLNPVNKSMVESLVDILRRKGGNRGYLEPYITRLLSMSRRSLDALVNASSSGSDSVDSADDSPAGLVDILRQYEDKSDDSSDLKSVFDSVTERYLKRLFDATNTFEDLLQSEPVSYPTNYISPVQRDKNMIRNVNPSYADILDMAGLNQSGVVSAESSYFQLPTDLAHDVFPIHVDGLPPHRTYHRAYPKQDQTFQELEDILTRRYEYSSPVPQEPKLPPKPPPQPPAGMPTWAGEQLGRSRPPDASLTGLDKHFSFIKYNIVSDNTDNQTLDVFEGLEELPRGSPTAGVLGRSGPPDASLPGLDKQFSFIKYNIVSDNSDNQTLDVFEGLKELPRRSPTAGVLGRSGLPDASLPGLDKHFSFIKYNIVEDNPDNQTLDVFEGLEELSPRRSPNTTLGRLFASRSREDVQLTIPSDRDKPIVGKRQFVEEVNISTPTAVEFGKGLGWAGATLRKIREAANLNVSSSSTDSEISPMRRRKSYQPVEIHEISTSTYSPRSPSRSPKALPPNIPYSVSDKDRSGVSTQGRKTPRQSPSGSPRKSPLKSPIKPPTIRSPRRDPSPRK